MLHKYGKQEMHEVFRGIGNWTSLTSGSNVNKNLVFECFITILSLTKT